MKKVGRILAVAALSTATVTLSLGPPAHADDPNSTGNWTGGDISTDPNPFPSVERQQAADKHALAAAYVAAKRGQGSVAQFRSLGRSYISNHGLEGGQLRTDITSNDATLATTSLTASDRVLAVDQYAQLKSFYCGPGSGKMILKYMNAGPSAYNGAPQDQEHIAGSAHMDTEAAGVTSWGSGLFRVGLNRWREGKIDGYYVNLGSPSVSQFTNSLTFDVDYGYPFGADTVEFAGGYHYNGHPSSQTIGHWIVPHGYYSDGASARFADPATSVWSTVSPHFTYNTSNFVNRFLQSNGITW